MGAAKEQMLREDGYVEWAKTILAKHEAISECEIHGHYEDNLAGDEVFEEAVTEGIERSIGDLTPERVREIFQAAIDDTGMECPGCMAHFDRD